MLLTIDNLDGFGPRDYTAALSLEKPPLIKRRLNQPTLCALDLVSTGAQFVVPVAGARIIISRSDGLALFTGYVSAAPDYEYLGWNERGPVYRYALAATSDEFVLDRRMLPARSAFVNRTAGNALTQLANDLLPGSFSTAAVEDIATIPSFRINPEHPWSKHASDLAQRARAAYRAHNGALVFAPVGANVHNISESDAGFCPDNLKLASPQSLVNDVTLTGGDEPQAHVKDYFLGDGLTVRFNLSHRPFTRNDLTLVDEEFLTATLAPTRWSVADPSHAISVSSGALQVAGGTGADGATAVTFAEQIELGGALQLQHGDVLFSAASNGVLGGLYTGAIAAANCFAGFQVTPSGAQSIIQPLINGALAGSSLTTVAGHHYRLTTRLYATEIYRLQQTFFSSAHPAGSGRGGSAISASMRVVLEVHDIDPANPASLQALSTVLYDNLLSAPQYCSYALVNSPALHCAIAFTRLLRVNESEVRSAQPSAAYRTRLAGSVADGAECSLNSGSAPYLQFFSQYVPVTNEAIVVRYRDLGRAVARVNDPVSIATNARGNDDGTRAAMRHLALPEPRTQPECEFAAQCFLDDSVQPAWRGQYELWSDFLPNGPATDPWPGDAVGVNVPSRNANFTAIIREVDITLSHPGSPDGAGFAPAGVADRSQYKLAFANDAAAPLAMALQLPRKPVNVLTSVPTATAGSQYIADLALAEVTAVSSTTVSIDAGAAPPAGGGIEVRISDSEWGPAGDRNLVGRFATQTFSVTRLTRLVTYYLRQYDASSPPKYSRYSTALHVDYPA